MQAMAGNKFSLTKSFLPPTTYNFKTTIPSGEQKTEGGLIPHTYGEIPDSIPTKRFAPIMRYVIRIIRELGLEFFEEIIPKLTDELIYEVFKSRLDTSIEFAKAVIDGKIPDPSTSMCYAFFPPVLTIRGDLQQGTGKLLYGESNDISFVCINDLTNEVFFILNVHCEDGIPVDWWLAGPNDELLERRHLKYGFKLREVSQKIKSFTKIGIKIIDLLKDIRNERTPQWTDSIYTISMVYGAGVINVLNEVSSYEAIGMIYDGISAKRTVGEYLYCYVPWPPLIETLTYMPRSDFIMRLVGLTTGGLLYCTQFDRRARAKLREMAPEVLKFGAYMTWEEEGVPTPPMTLGVQLPNLKDKRVYKEEKFDWVYPEGHRITLADVGMDVEDAMDGILTNLTQEFPLDQKFTPNNIISTGIGVTTKYKKEHHKRMI